MMFLFNCQFYESLWNVKFDQSTIDEAEDYVVFNVKDNYEESHVNLAGLKFDEDDCTHGWTIRKEKYFSGIATAFDELLNGNFGDICSF